MKKILIKQFLKYGLVTFFGYIFLLTGTYFFVEKIGWSKELSYLILISIIYVWSYMLNTRIVFKVGFSDKNLIRYLMSLCLFWFLNNIFFSFYVRILEIDYLLAIIFNIFILGIIRFFVQKYLVFK